MAEEIKKDAAAPAPAPAKKERDKVQKEVELAEKAPFGVTLLITLSWFLIIPIFLYIGSRNKFKNEEIEIQGAVSQIDVYLRQRFDMLSKMVDSIKGSMKFESETLTKIAEMRSGLGKVNKGSHSQASQLSNIENQMNEINTGINMQMERYPELKSSALVSQFITEAKEVEENLASARRIYNRNVKIFNKRVVNIPSSLVASKMRLTKWDMYEVADYAREDVQVDFGF